MSKMVRKLIECLRLTFSLEFIDKVARRTKFVQRESTLTAQKFISLCAFYKDSICETSLSKLCSIVAAEENIIISPQALNERFNEYSVEFLKEILKELLINQNNVLRKDGSKLQNMFNRINVVDSTSFKISDNLKDTYKGTGGHSANAAVKIQLQYNILSGQFLACDVGKGATSDTEYVPEIQKSIQPKDLFLKDLGYFKMEDLNIIDKSEAFYISKLKKYSVIYINDGKKYSQIDILEKVKDLKIGETLDIPDAYIGSNKKLKSRLIITKLSDENKRKREIKYQQAEKRHKSRMDDERLDIWNSINIYVTNIDKHSLCAEQIHDLYTLRWQVEIMFKIWKSIFRIDRVKKVKLHRFQCFLYGKLISILLSSIIVFKAKENLNLNERKHISEFKAFAIVKEYSCNIKDCVFSKSGVFPTMINNIFKLISKCGVKSKNKRKKSSGDILDSIELAVSNMGSL
jgi:hypothetical protein